jgi:hypothetical protein
MVKTELRFGGARRQERVRQDEVGDDGGGGIGWRLRAVGRQAVQAEGREEGSPVEDIN